MSLGQLWTRLLCMLLAAFGMAGCAANGAGKLGRSAMFPPDVGWPGGLLVGAGEPPLWTSVALQGFRSRWRVSIRGIARDRIIVRIDETSRGSISGTYIRYWKGDHRTDLRERRSFRVTRKQLAELQALAKDRQILTAPRQGWTLTDDEAMCLDGEEVLIEAVDAQGYRAAGANAQCTAPAGLLDVAAKIIQLSGGRGLGLIGR